MNAMIKVAPSLLSADFSKLAEQIRAVEEGGCDLLHLDIMDGNFVPNITFGPIIVKAIDKLTGLPLDAHLMIDNPEKYWERFREAGADWISIHIEAAKNPSDTLEKIKKSGARAGIVINPKTSIKTIEHLLGIVNFVLVMTVEPGFGGQAFDPKPVEKIKLLKGRIDEIEVDGGIDDENIIQVLAAGATTIVSGSSIFRKGDSKERTQKFRNIIDDWQRRQSGKEM
jgi:ribulose-phosphate 3-epimerase